MTILEIHNMLIEESIEHEFIQNNFEPSKNKIAFNDSSFDRQIAVSTKTQEIELFVYISKTKKKKWDEKQTKEQNSECGREKNRFTKEFNKFNIDFKLTEWISQTNTQKFEGAIKVAVTKEEEIKGDMKITKPVENLDFQSFGISDDEVIMGFEDNPYDKK
jgi:hypothetical protein